MKKINFTQEMVDDLYKIGDQEYVKKWNISRASIIKFRKSNNIPSFTPKYGTIPHRAVGDIEYKWCPMGEHWVSIDEFNIERSRYDGLDGVCRFHRRQISKKSYHTADGRGQHKVWRETDVGKESLRRTWRKQSAIKKDAYWHWTKQDEERAYYIFDKCCAYCKTPLEFLELEFDHVMPISRGGKTAPNNMVPCCVECNHGPNGKFNRELFEWLMDKFGEHQADRIYQYIREKMKIICP